MKWRFSSYPLDMVETDVTQRDQFRNDDVDLADSLGRESIQNSLDAAVQPGNGPVRLRFSFRQGSSAPASDYLKKLFEGHEEHAKAAGINVAAIDFKQPAALVVEDFGTKGLTGRLDVKDSDNFSDFWRRHGRSHKSGKSLGRWGLGKLVFSMSSQLNAFFGLTVQSDTGNRALMGQTVLGMHTFGGEEFPSHTFFAEVNAGGGGKAGLPVPVTDDGYLNEFTSQFGLKRTTEPGLSVVIPFPSQDLDRERMIVVAISNYFIPILHKQLVLEFDDIRIDERNITDLARKYVKDKIRDIEAVFQFVREADGAVDVFRPADQAWYRDGRLTEKAFREEDIQQMRDRLTKGQLVSVELPIEVGKSADGQSKTRFRIFLKKPDDITHGQDFYLRSGISVPQEAKFRERKALGMLIANDEPISAFLGDAENASHTKWNGKAEKLKGYAAAEIRLKAIRNSVLELHDLLVQVVEAEDRQALLDFFWTPGAGTSPKKKKPATVPPPPNPPDKPEAAIIRIAECPGGIVVQPGREIKPEDLPCEISVQLAYDVSQGNPFRLYSEADFDLGDEDGMQIEASGGVTVEAAKNELKCKISTGTFTVKITGFDEKRDLIVRAEG